MRASESAYATLREEILTWRLLPGTPLGEVEVALRLGVSRTPLRAALARLALEGLIDDSRGRTAVVSEVSPTGLAELFELREALEVAAARLAAKRGDRQAFAALALQFTVADATLRSDGVDAYYGVIAGYDAAIDDAVANPSLRAALDTVRTHLVRARRLAADDVHRLLRAADEHRLICEAIAGGDADLAAAATAVHLHGALQHMLANLATHHGTPTEARR